MRGWNVTTIPKPWELGSRTWQKLPSPSCSLSLWNTSECVTKPVLGRCQQDHTGEGHRTSRAWPCTRAEQRLSAMNHSQEDTGSRNEVQWALAWVTEQHWDNHCTRSSRRGRRWHAMQGSCLEDPTGQCQPPAVRGRRGAAGRQQAALPHSWALTESRQAMARCSVSFLPRESLLPSLCLLFQSDTNDFSLGVFLI